MGEPTCQPKLAAEFLTIFIVEDFRLSFAGLTKIFIVIEIIDPASGGDDKQESQFKNILNYYTLDRLWS